MSERTDLMDPDYLRELLDCALVEGGHLPSPDEVYNIATHQSWRREELRQKVIAKAQTALADQISEMGEDCPRWVIDLLKAIQIDEEFLLAICHEVYQQGWSHGSTHVEADVDALQTRHTGDVMERLQRFINGLTEPKDRDPLYRDRLDYLPYWDDYCGIRWRVLDHDTGFLVDDGFPSPQAAIARINEFPERP